MQLLLVLRDDSNNACVQETSHSAPGLFFGKAYPLSCGRPTLLECSELDASNSSHLVTARVVSHGIHVCTPTLKC